MKYCINPDAKLPIMLIDNFIGVDEKGNAGIIGADFARELHELDQMGKEEIEIQICSEGGSVMDGMKIYTAILATKAKVNTYNTGVAASIAAVLLQSGRTRKVASYALTMVHNPFNPDPSGTQEEKDSLAAMRDSIIKMISSRCGQTEETVAKMMDKTTWMNASEAVLMGYADEIVDSATQNVPRLRKGDAKAAYKLAMNFLNKANEQHTYDMKQVLNKLQLVDGSNEEVILNAINKMESDLKAQNKITTDQLDQAKKALDEANAKYTDLKSKYDAFEEEKKKADTEKEEKEKAAAKENAKNLVTNAVKLGKIKNEAAAIKTWTDQAEKDFAGTKAQLDALAVTKTGVNVVDQLEEENKVGATYNASAVMANIAAKNKQF